MRLTIQLGAEAGDTRLRTYIVRRLGFALSRLEDRITSVLVRCSDVNGPKGGVDKRSTIEVRGPVFGRIVVEETGAEWVSTIDRAAARAGHTLVRALERGRRAINRISWRSALADDRDGQVGRLKRVTTAVGER